MNKNNPLSLFSDFPPVSTKQWEDKILEDLKGMPFEKLIWEAAGKLKINPFYRHEDLKDITYLNSFPGYFPLIKSDINKSNEWKIQQEIHVSDFEEANSLAFLAIDQGANSICFIIPENIQLSQQNLTLLLNHFPVDRVYLDFEAPGNEENIIKYLADNNSSANFHPEKIRMSLNFDPLGKLVSTGSFYNSEIDDFNKCHDLIKNTSGILPHIKVISVNSQIFHNAGGTPVQELALSLAMVSEYLDRLTEKKVSIDDLANTFRFNMATGPLYFIEIAKFRAARLLFMHLLKAWKPVSENFMGLFIHAKISEWNQTIFDPYMNILRGTTEAMSAILGGVNSLTISPLGSSYRKTTESDERIVRNIQIILKEEAFFDKVIDPAGGSYYIEKITDILAEEAWSLFLKLEEEGGFYNSFKSGYIQNLIKDSATVKKNNIAVQKEVLVGTNQYPDFSESPDIEYEKIFNTCNENHSDDVIAEPIQKYRASLPFEELRFRTLENTAGKPKVFLLGYGDPKWYIARAVFSTNFFGCAGYEVIPVQYFPSVQEGVEAAIKSKASIVVLCSSDEAYKDIAPEAKMLLNDHSILVIAGFPKDAEFLKFRGIDHFIHKKSDLIEELNKFHQILGIKHIFNLRK